MPWHVAVLNWLLEFLKDGENGTNSSSRLIAVGGATIMACYMGADILLRYMLAIFCIANLYLDQPLCYSAGMDKDVLIACVAGLCALGGVVYGVNRVATTIKAKRQQKPADDEAVLP